ncbi:hypothetical protein KAR91_07810, partial [Candidatus Pacearchaeota archaeon]|nr:hypothetical protein [Candidatus Pacearchaeota archaeon]
GEDADNDGFGDINIHVTGEDPYEIPGTVNSSVPGMGVNNNFLDNLTKDSAQENPASEKMFLKFTDTTPDDPSDPAYDLTAADITVDSLDETETAVWTVYDTNGETDGLWTKVNEGTSTGTAKADTTFTVDGGVDPVTGLPNTFDAIVLEAEDGCDYRTLNITTYSTDYGQDNTITYDILVTDGDGDTASSSFDVTFDADGNITGTDANEVISGSNDADSISGGAGEDIIYGRDGDDSIFANDGEVDIISGGAGEDTIEVDMDGGGVSLDILLDDPGVDPDTII